MPSDTIDVQVPDVTTSSTRDLLLPVRRLVVRALLAGLGYSVLAVASRVQCFGGVDEDGGFIDSQGNPTDVPQRCVAMTLHASPVVYLVLALAVVWAISRAARPGLDAAAAGRTLRRASVGVVVLAVLALVMTFAAFMSVPFDRWDGTGAPPIPRWLVVDVSVPSMDNPGVPHNP